MFFLITAVAFSSTYLTEISSLQQFSSDETNNLLTLLLFAVPFGAVVLRMSDEESLSKKYLKLSTIVIFVSMGSLTISQTLVTGNAYHGYALVPLAFGESESISVNGAPTLASSQ